MLIGLVGLNCSGKDSVAEYLQSKGFENYSLSDIIREEIKSRGREITRSELIAVGTELREKFGNSILAQKSFAKLKGKNAIFTSIRNPEEAKFLKTKGVKIVEVFAEPKIRFERNLLRARENAPQTLEAFLQDEEKELKSANSASQQLLACIALCDKIIENNSSREELQKNIDKVLLENCWNYIIR